jgi:hypothetical protein
MMALDASSLHSKSKRESLIKANFIAVKPGDEFMLKGIHSGSKTRYMLHFIAYFCKLHIS